MLPHKPRGVVSRAEQTIIERALMNHLYLIRHGENRANLTLEFSYKNVDYPLTPRGVLQAQQTAAYLADKEIDAIYSSPLKRTLQTAEIIASHLNLEIEVLENFREMNVGQLEGHPDLTEAWKINYQVTDAWWAGQPEKPFPGGENRTNLWARMQAGLTQISEGKSGRNLVVIGHGGLFTFTVEYLCPQDDFSWLEESVNYNCSISEVTLNQHNGSLCGRLVRWAWYEHLHGKAAQVVSGLARH
jgi:broad specificity phosphatase PhoE